MYTIHRILGTLLSTLFLVWFLSAFVMMYHGFPRASQAEKIGRQDYLTPASLPALEEVVARLPEGEKVKNIRVDRLLGQTVFHIRTAEAAYDLPADSTEQLPANDGERIRNIAALWCAASIQHIDTLNHLDQWIPFGSLKKEFPIYKFHFDDHDHHQLYIGSRSGEVLQFTTRNERFWAWLGAIPHWVYFTRLRQDAALWSKTVIWLSGLGCLMTVAGLWVGIDVWRRYRKRGNGFSPYRKKWYHWHYVTGIVFGLFVLTFCFSGLISLAEVPAWISKPVLQKNPLREIKKGFRPENYVLDYRQIISEYPDVRQIEWSNFRSILYYIVKHDEAELYIDASSHTPRPLRLTEAQVSEAVRSIHGDSAELRISLLNEFETDYRDMSRMYRSRSLLPVWKITVDDADRSCYYIHPETAVVRYVNTTARWKYWMYTALHRLRIQGLNSSPALRKSVLWLLLLGGTGVSLSGVVLGLRYVERKCRRKRKR